MTHNTTENICKTQSLTEWLAELPASQPVPRDGVIFAGDLCVLDLSPFLLSSLPVSQYPEMMLYLQVTCVYWTWAHSCWAPCLSASTQRRLPPSFLCQQNLLQRMRTVVAAAWARSSVSETASVLWQLHKRATRHTGKCAAWKVPNLQECATKKVTWHTGVCHISHQTYRIVPHRSPDIQECAT